MSKCRLRRATVITRSRRSSSSRTSIPSGMRIPQNWTSARATVAIAAVTAVAWLLVALAGVDSYAALWGGFIPARVGGAIQDSVLAPVWLTPLTCTLVHDGFA